MPLGDGWSNQAWGSADLAPAHPGTAAPGSPPPAGVPGAPHSRHCQVMKHDLFICSFLLAVLHSYNRTRISHYLLLLFTNLCKQTIVILHYPNSGKNEKKATRICQSRTEYNNSKKAEGENLWERGALRWPQPFNGTGKFHLQWLPLSYIGLVMAKDNDDNVYYCIQYPFQCSSLALRLSHQNHK